MRVLNKTPSQNEYTNVYKIEDVNHSVIKNILQSRFIADGIYSIEQYSSSDYSEVYLSSPSFDKFPYQKVSKKWEFDKDTVNVSVYELVLEKPLFMPLDTNNFADLINKVAKECNFPVFLQVLLSKRRDNWREIAISQYESFLKGNENFINFKPIDRIQEGLLKVFNKIGGFKLERDPIEEIEKKILQENVRFECRFVLFEPEKEGNLIREVYSAVDDLTLFNRLELKKVRDTEDVLDRINRRRFTLGSVNQLLSQQEVYSLLCDSGQHVDTISNVSHVNKPTSLIKTIQNNHFNEAVNILPFQEKRNLEIDQEIVGQIQQAFSRVKISKEPLKVEDIERGARLQKIEIKIPSDKNYTDIKKNVENIKAALGKDSLSIEIGDKPETINLYVACEDTELIYLKQIISSPEFSEYAKEKVLPIVLGEDVIGNPLFACLSELRHLLIAGATGSGKSVFLNCLLISLILYVNPDELALYLIDPKMVELTPYDGFPQVKEVITDMKKASTLLGKLTVEMDKRYELLSKSGYRDVKGYNKKAEVKLPYLVCVVDEYADLVGTNPEVEDYIQRLGQKARAAGIHVILATQRPSADILDGAIKINFPSRISFKLETSSDYMTVFGKGIPFELLGRGDGCAKIEGFPKQYQRFQSPIITLDDDEWIDVIGKLKKVFADANVPDVELEEIVTIEPIEELKRIIANTGNTKISDLQAEMGIGINKVTELMRQLVDEEWLGRDGRKYIVLADEDELKQWRNTE